jgi:hypothetical protein
MRFAVIQLPITGTRFRRMSKAQCAHPTLHPIVRKAQDICRHYSLPGWKLRHAFGAHNCYEDCRLLDGPIRLLVADVSPCVVGKPTNMLDFIQGTAKLRLHMPSLHQIMPECTNQSAVSPCLDRINLRAILQ